MVRRIGHGVKRTLSILLSLAIIISLLPLTAQAGDYENHWARESVERAVEMGWFLETQDGIYRPGASITRAEFVTMINRLKGYTGTANLGNFTDVKSGDWFYGAFSAAVAAGYIIGDDNKLSPNEPITRNEAVTIFARISGLAESKNASAVLKNVRDASDIPDWAIPFAASAINNGLIAGFEENFNGSQNITRAETAVMLERLYDDARVFAFPGEFTWDNGEAQSVTVMSAGVTLKNAKVKDTLTIAESVGNGDVILDNVNVLGALDILGGGSESVYIKGGAVNKLSILKDYVHVVVSHLAVVSDITLGSVSPSLELQSGSTAQTVTTLPTANKASVSVGASSAVDTITAEAPETKITLASDTEIKTLNLAQSAVSSYVETESGGKITTLNVSAAGTNVYGKGTIGTANIKAQGAVIEQKPGKTNVDSGLQANVGGQTVSGGSGGGNGGGGNGGGGYTPTVSASASVQSASQIAVTMDMLTGASFTVSGNGYAGTASVVDYGTTKAGAYTLALTPALTKNLTYTLTVSATGYYSKNVSITWVQHTLQYDANGADDGTVPQSADFDTGAAATVSANTGGLEKTGMVFAGWHTSKASADAGSALFTGGETLTMSGNVILYAVWTPAVPVSDLTQSGVSQSDSVTLNWTNTANAKQVELYQKAVSGDETVYDSKEALAAAGYVKAAYSGTLTDSSNSAVITGLTPNTVYTFYLAVTGGDNAGISNKVQAQTAQAIVNITSDAFETTATDNAIVITLTDGTFKETAGFNDFAFTGTAIGTLTASDLIVARVSETEVRVALKTGTFAAASDNRVTVTATALSSGSAGTDAAATAGSYYQVSGTVLPGTGANASELSVAGQWVRLYSENDTVFASPLGSAQTDQSGGFIISGLHEDGESYVLAITSIPTALPGSAFTLTQHKTDAELTINLPVLDASGANVSFSDTGVVTWDAVDDAESYDILLYKDTVLKNTVQNAVSGESVLAKMHGGGAGSYTVKLIAKAAGYESGEAVCTDTRTISQASASAVVYTHADTTLAWTGTGAESYTVRIYQKVGTGTPTVYKTYYVTHTDGSETLDVSDSINGTTPAGEYTFTVQAMAARDSEHIYTTLTFDGEETGTDSSDMPEVTGTIDVTVTMIGAQGTTIPASLNVGSSFTKNAGDTQEMLSTSGVTITGTGGAFDKSYAGFMLKQWSVTGPGTLSTQYGLGTVLTIEAEARSLTPVAVEAEFSGTNVYAAPFYLANNGSGYKTGDIVFTQNSAGKVDIVPDSSFSSTGLVYFVTKEQSFTFYDNSRGGQSAGGVDSFTYTRTADTGTAAEMWDITAEVSSYDGFTVAVNGAFAGDGMTTISRTVKITEDFSGTVPFYFGTANTGDYDLTIDGGTNSIDFGFMFGTGAQNVTLKNLDISLIGNSKAAKAPDNTTAAVFISAGESITVEDMTISTIPTAQGAGDGAGQPVYIGKDVTDDITIRSNVITAEGGSGYGAAIYIANNAFAKVSITDNDLTSNTPIAVNLAGVTLSGANAGNISGNTMTSTRNPIRTVRIDNLVADFLMPTLTGGAVSNITLTDYFDSETVDTLLTSLANAQEGFVISLGTTTGNSATVVMSGGAWTLTAYQNSGTLSNTTAFVSGEYDKDTGVLTIETSGAIPAGVKLDLRMFVILGGVRLDTAGADEPQNDYSVQQASSATGLGDGEWHWSNDTLTIKLSANDKARVDGMISGVPASTTMYAWAGWNTADGYNSASATASDIPCTVTTSA